MNAYITRETFVFTVFRRVFHSTLKLELCRHACRRRDLFISTCRYGKNMPTTALGATLTEKRTRGTPCTFMCKQVLQGRKRQGRQNDGEKDERGAMQFQVPADAPGKKPSAGAPNWRRKRRKGRHAVSRASRGSREENVRGAKLT